MTMFHIWQYNTSRSALVLLQEKPIGRWNQDLEPAVWRTRSAAHRWGAQRWDPTDYMVMQCQGVGLCALVHFDEEERADE